MANEVRCAEQGIIISYPTISASGIVRLFLPRETTEIFRHREFTFIKSSDWLCHHKGLFMVESALSLSS